MPKTGVLFVLPLIQSIRQEIGHPKGAIRDIFRGRFIPYFDKRGDKIGHFQNVES
jgi:hypothetical protein